MGEKSPRSRWQEKQNKPAGAANHAHGKAPPRCLHQRSSKWFVILTTTYAVFVDVFLYGIIVPVLPFALTRRIGIKPEDVQHWISVLLAVYGGALLVTCAFGGWLVDQFNLRKWSYLGGLAFLIGSTLMLCLARSIAVMVVGRILQAMSAGVVWTVATVLMTDRVGVEGTGEAMGYMTLGRSVAIVLGPLLGGIVYAHAGYYAVFGICFGLEVFDVVLRLWLIEAREANKWDPTIGPPQSSDSEEDGNRKSSLDAMQPQTDETGEQIHDIEPATLPIETSPPAASLDGESPTASGVDPGAIQQTRNKTSRFIDRCPPILTLLLIPRILISLWGAFMQSVALTSLDATLPLFVKATFGWNSNGAGLIFLALVIPTFISPVIGYLADKWGGVRWWCSVGYVASCVPLILLRLVSHDSMHDKIVLAVLLAFLGGLMMFFEIPLWVEIIKVTDEVTKKQPERYAGKDGNGATGQAYGLANFFFSAGMVVGPIWAGFLYNDAGWGTMTLSMGVVLGSTALPTVLFTGGWLFDRKKEKNGTTPNSVEEGRQSQTEMML